MVKSLCIILIALVGLVSCSDDDEKPPVVQNEDIFINEIYASGDDWIELYNAGETDKNIGGYFIYDDAANKYMLQGITIVPAKGFLILSCDDIGVGLHTNFKLTSDGETLYLESSAGTLIDQVEFPALNDGQSYGRYPDGSDDFAISGNTSKGATNGASEAPAVSETARTPMVPLLSNDVTVTTNLISTSDVSSVKLFYRLGSGAFTEITMSLGSGSYSAIIPAQNTTGKVEYYIEVKSTAGQTVLDPVGGSADPYSFLLNTDELPSLFINEFLAANTSCCPDSDGGIIEFDDWIEIYNAGATSVDIGGMYLSDNKSNPFKYQVPAGNAAATTIPAGGFIVLWADGSKSQGSRHLELSLAAEGEDLGIYYIDGRTIDEYTFGIQAENKSTGRSINGGDTWVSFTTPTPGTSNN